MSLNQFEILQATREREAAVVKKMLAEIENLSRTDPEWFAHFDHIELDAASRADLVELMVNAPTDSARFFLFGRYNARVALAAVTGRAFV